MIALYATGARTKLPARRVTSFFGSRPVTSVTLPSGRLLFARRPYSFSQTNREASKLAGFPVLGDAVLDPTYRAIEGSRR